MALPFATTGTPASGTSQSSPTLTPAQQAAAANRAYLAATNQLAAGPSSAYQKMAYQPNGSSSQPLDPNSIAPGTNLTGKYVQLADGTTYQMQGASPNSAGANTTAPDTSSQGKDTYYQDAQGNKYGAGDYFTNKDANGTTVATDKYGNPLTLSTAPVQNTAPLREAVGGNTMNTLAQQNQTSSWLGGAPSSPISTGDPTVDAAAQKNYQDQLNAYAATAESRRQADADAAKSGQQTQQQMLNQTQAQNIAAAGSSTPLITNTPQQQPLPPSPQSMPASPGQPQINAPGAVQNPLAPTSTITTAKNPVTGENNAFPHPSQSGGIDYSVMANSNFPDWVNSDLTAYDVMHQKSLDLANQSIGIAKDNALKLADFYKGQGAIFNQEMQAGISTTNTNATQMQSAAAMQRDVAQKMNSLAQQRAANDSAAQIAVATDKNNRLAGFMAGKLAAAGMQDSGAGLQMMTTYMATSQIALNQQVSDAQTTQLQYAEQNNSILANWYTDSTNIEAKRQVDVQNTLNSMSEKIMGVQSNALASQSAMNQSILASIKTYNDDSKAIQDSKSNEVQKVSQTYLDTMKFNHQILQDAATINISQKQLDLQTAQFAWTKQTTGDWSTPDFIVGKGFGSINSKTGEFMASENMPNRGQGPYTGNDVSPTVNNAPYNNVPPTGNVNTGKTLRQKAAPYNDLIQSSSKNNNLDPDILTALLNQESGYLPDVITGKRVSSAGAQGIGQFMPPTAKGIGLKNPLDPNEAIPASAAYLSQKIAKYGGDLDKGLAAYNAGEGNVNKAIRLATKAGQPNNWLNYLTQVTGVKKALETQNYVTSINSQVASLKAGSIPSSATEEQAISQGKEAGPASPDYSTGGSQAQPKTTTPSSDIAIVSSIKGMENIPTDQKQLIADLGNKAISTGTEYDGKGGLQSAVNFYVTAKTGGKGLLPAATRAVVQGLSDGFSTQLPVKEFMNVRSAHDTMQGLGKTSADQLGWLEAYARAINPDQGIRYGSISQISDAIQSKSDKFGQDMVNIFQNKGGLVPKNIDAIKAAVNNIYNAKLADYKLAYDQTAEQIKSKSPNQIDDSNLSTLFPDISGVYKKGADSSLIFSGHTFPNAAALNQFKKDYNLQ